MTGRPLLDRASIIDVWAALGGGPLRHGRGVAFWRGGDGFNVSLDESCGVYFDHAHGEGGGILRLIQTLLATGGVDDERASLQIWAHAFDDKEADKIQAEIERVESMPPAEWRAACPVHRGKRDSFAAREAEAVSK